MGQATKRPENCRVVPVEHPTNPGKRQVCAVLMNKPDGNAPSGNDVPGAAWANNVGGTDAGAQRNVGDDGFGRRRGKEVERRAIWDGNHLCGLSGGRWRG